MDDKITLTKSQRKVFNAFKKGQNIFMTGKGGTGKSFITRYIIDYAKSKKKQVIVCLLARIVTSITQEVKALPRKTM